MSIRRTSKVNEFIREEISDLIHRSLKDPRLATVVSITEVRTSQDLRQARVFVSVLGDESDREQTIQVLRAAATFLRQELKHRMTTKQVPFLTFVTDRSIEEGMRLSTLIDEVALGDLPRG